MNEVWLFTEEQRIVKVRETSVHWSLSGPLARATGLCLGEEFHAELRDPLKVYLRANLGPGAGAGAEAPGAEAPASLASSSGLLGLTEPGEAEPVGAFLLAREPGSLFAEWAE